MSISYLSHTADIRMKLENVSLQDLFIEAVLGMNNILKEGFCDDDQEYTKNSNLNINAPDATCLLIDFLSEVLSLTYANKTMYCNVNFFGFSENLLIVEVSGKSITSFDEEIKAVTYHEADLRINNNKEWQTTIVFDI